MQQQLRLEYATIHSFRVWRIWHAKSQSQSATIENILQVHFKYLDLKKTILFKNHTILITRFSTSSKEKCASAPFINIETRKMYI